MWLVFTDLNVIFFGLSSVDAGSSPEDPAEEPPEGLQPDGATGGQRLPPSHRCLLPQFDTDHGCGRCLQMQLVSTRFSLFIGLSNLKIYDVFFNMRDYAFFFENTKDLQPLVLFC